MAVYHMPTMLFTHIWPHMQSMCTLETAATTELLMIVEQRKMLFVSCQWLSVKTTQTIKI